MTTKKSAVNKRKLDGKGYGYFTEKISTGRSFAREIEKEIRGKKHGVYVFCPRKVQDWRLYCFERKGGTHYNPCTGEMAYPDLKTPKWILPHWDYSNPAMKGSEKRDPDTGKPIGPTFDRVFPVKQELSIAILIRKIKNYLRTHAHPLIVIENSTTVKSDGWLSEAETPYFVYNEEVYFYLNNKKANVDAIGRAIAEGTGTYKNIIYFLDHILPLKSNTIKLDLLAKRVKEVAVDAYDLNGYIYCSLSG